MGTGQYPSSATADVNVVTTNETAVITSSGVSTQSPASTVLIECDINFLTGAATTAVTVRLRRGAGVGGALVGEAKPITVGAAVNLEVAFQWTDTPGEVAGQQYTVTIQQTAATGNGTAASASVSVSLDTP